jgi:hypothetical protein
MSARLLRRTFASPFVVTLAAIPAACIVQSAPPSRTGPPPSDRQPGPRTSEPAQPTPAPTPAQSEPTVMANPPRPGTEQATPEPAKTERHWTVSRQGDKCLAYTDVTCPKNATCNPPPPTAYACTPEITATQPMKIVQWANTTGCHVETPAPPCPPRKMCEPPRPRAVTCPQ